jgi:hypothetical protein
MYLFVFAIREREHGPYIYKPGYSAQQLHPWGIPTIGWYTQPSPFTGLVLDKSRERWNRDARSQDFGGKIGLWESETRETR